MDRSTTRHWMAAAAIALPALAAAPANAISLNIEFAGDGSVRTTTDYLAGDGSVRPIDVGGVVLGDGSVRTLRGGSADLGGLSVQNLNVSTKSDPFIDYNFSILSNIDGPITLNVTFGAIYVGGPYNLLTHLFDVDVKDGRGDGVVIDGLKHIGSIDGVPKITLGPALGCSIPAGAPGVTVDCTDGTAEADVLSNASGVFSINFELILSPYDQAFVTGRLELLNQVDVPEPATLLVLGAGLLGLGLARRRLG